MTCVSKMVDRHHGKSLRSDDVMGVKQMVYGDETAYKQKGGVDGRGAGELEGGDLRGHSKTGAPLLVLCTTTCCLITWLDVGGGGGGEVLARLLDLVITCGRCSLWSSARGNEVELIDSHANQPKDHFDLWATTLVDDGDGAGVAVALGASETLVLDCTGIISEDLDDFRYENAATATR